MTPITIVKAVRTTVPEWDGYRAEAELEEMTVNSWIRRALNDAVQLSRMVRHQAYLESLPPKNVN